MVREVRWKFFVKQDTWFRLLLVFLSLKFHKVVEQHIWGEVGSLLIILLQISYWMCRWKNYENRSIFSKDMDKSIVCGFLGATLYIRCFLRESVFGRFDTILAYDGQTDRQTDRQTDGRTDTWRHNIGLPRYSIASRGKNVLYAYIFGLLNWTEPIRISLKCLVQENSSSVSIKLQVSDRLSGFRVGLLAGCSHSA